jgi:hypothetical protein
VKHPPPGVRERIHGADYLMLGCIDKGDLAGGSRQGPGRALARALASGDGGDVWSLNRASGALGYREVCKMAATAFS